jgi:RNA polymerase sigma-70 factor (ECF subfamily)
MKRNPPAIQLTVRSEKHSVYGSPMKDGLDTLLARWRQGDQDAGERALALAYAELRRLAAYYFRMESPGHTLQPTALVNEVYMKLAGGQPVPWQNRAHFFAVMARQMRLILVDHARRRRALKRSDTQMVFSLASGSRSVGPRQEDLLAVDRALEELEKLDQRAAKVTELRVFAGLKESEIAETLEISVATVKRDWNFARAWLLTQLGNTE